LSLRRILTICFLVSFETFQGVTIGIDVAGGLVELFVFRKGLKGRKEMTVACLLGSKSTARFPMLAELLISAPKHVTSNLMKNEVGHLNQLKREAESWHQ
jgi:hypothetical protein